MDLLVFHVFGERNKIPNISLTRIRPLCNDDNILLQTFSNSIHAHV